MQGRVSHEQYPSTPLPKRVTDVRRALNLLMSAIDSASHALSVSPLTAESEVHSLTISYFRPVGLVGRRSRTRGDALTRLLSHRRPGGVSLVRVCRSLPARGTERAFGTACGLGSH